MKKYILMFMLLLGCVTVLYSCSADDLPVETFTESGTLAVTDADTYVHAVSTDPSHVHTEVIDAAKAATCSETGLTEGRHCSTCNMVIVKQEVINALGHAEVIDLGTPATCKQNGISDGKHCSVCNTVTVPQEIIPIVPHTEEIIPGKAATCTKTGLSDGKRCSVCDTVILNQETIPALGHTEVVVKGTPATCTKDGTTDSSYCSVCKTIMIDQTTIPASDHKWLSATCSNPELCSVCNTTVGNAVDHKDDGTGKCVYCAKSMLVDMRTRVSAPLTDSNKTFVFGGGNYTFRLRWHAINTSGKSIKYFRITIEFYNVVGDRTVTVTTKRQMGPIADGEEMIVSGWHVSLREYYKKLQKVIITEIEIEYMDGTVERGIYNYSSTETSIYISGGEI